MQKLITAHRVSRCSCSRMIIPGDLIRYDPATREAKCPECVRKEERERGEKAMERMKMDEYTFRGAVLGFLLAICLGLVYIIGYLHLILQHIK